MNPQNRSMILGVIRHVLTTAGGALATQGTVSEDEVNTGIGAIITLIGIGWSVYEKRRKAAALPLKAD
jgi:hypothetical protein